MMSTCPYSSIDDDDYCLDDLIRFIENPPSNLSPPARVQPAPVRENRNSSAYFRNVPPRSVMGGRPSDDRQLQLRELGKRCPGKKSTRLDPESTEILETWFLRHQDNPFPTVPEKMELARATGLSLQQVGTWMTNIRKRRLYPITAGRREPKTDFDRELLEQHNRSVSSQAFPPFSSSPYSGICALSCRYKHKDVDARHVMPCSPSTDDDCDEFYESLITESRSTSFGAEIQFYLSDSSLNILNDDGVNENIEHRGKKRDSSALISQSCFSPDSFGVDSMLFPPDQAENMQMI